MIFIFAIYLLTPLEYAELISRRPQMLPWNGKFETFLWRGLRATLALDTIFTSSAFMIPRSLKILIMLGNFSGLYWLVGT